MMMPSIFGENLFDEWMDFPFESAFLDERIRCMVRMKKIL